MSGKEDGIGRAFIKLDLWIPLLDMRRKQVFLSWGLGIGVTLCLNDLSLAESRFEAESGQVNL
jgi:hypothetical protein